MKGKYVGASHFTETEAPKMCKWLDARGLRYEVRTLKWPSCKKRCISIQVQLPTDEDNNAFHAFWRSIYEK